MLVKQYTYQLAKRGKWICPQCGHKTFVCYVDSNNNVLNEGVGKCDRANNCAYHYPPRQYFDDNKGVLNAMQSRRPSRPTYRPQPPHVYIDPRMFKQYAVATMSHRNNLVDFLKPRFDEESVNQRVKDYYIGTSKQFGGGSTVFFQVDRYGKIHRGKIMQYNPRNGKRVKEPYPKFTTVHKVENLGDSLPPECLFGEHLLKKNPIITVAIVESEKTAIIADLVFGDCLTLACGGCGKLTRSMCEPLRGRDVILFPDNGKYEEWSEKGKNLRSLFGRLRISSIMEHNAVNPGDDIGDLILQRFPTWAVDLIPLDLELIDL